MVCVFFVEFTHDVTSDGLNLNILALVNWVGSSVNLAFRLQFYYLNVLFYYYTQYDTGLKM